MESQNMNNEINRRFHKYWVFLSLLGVYIPGIDRPKYPFFYIYGCLSIVFCVTICCDLMYLRELKILSESLSVFCIIAFASYLWSALKSMYFLIFEKNVVEIFNMWSHQLISNLWPEKREEELARARKISLRGLSFSTATLVLPYALNGLWKIAFKGPLFICSSFHEDPLSLDAPRYVIAYQATCVFFCCGISVAYPAFVLKMMNIIEAELQFLKFTLGEIFTELEISENGEINVVDPEENTVSKITEKTREKLAAWILFHGCLIQFQIRVKSFIAPLVLGEFLFLVTNIGGILYMSISGVLNTELMINCFIFIASYFINTYRLCRAGDKIIEKSSRLAEPALQANWIAYPKDVRKALYVICAVSQRGIMFDTAGVFELASTTFRKMAFLQYRFLRFMKDAR